MYTSFSICRFGQYPQELDLLLQVFCMALTKDVNLLETKKYDDTVDANDILVMEREVSKRYLFLAEVLSGHPDLERECVLTAFSMNPTQEFFDLVCTLAEGRHQLGQSAPSALQEGHTDLEQMTDTIKDIDSEPIENDRPETEFIDALHVITGGTQILDSKDYNAEVAPSRLIDELSMLSESVRHDLTCMLSVTRIKNLTWLTPWSKLKEECAQLLENELKKRIVEKTTAAANAKLQYLKLNYDEFKDFKPHEYPGIEKGYEMYVPESDSDDSVPKQDRDSDDTDTAPESKSFKTREAKRLSEKRRRQVRRSKQIMKQLDDEPEVRENRARAIDGEKKKKAIESMLNMETERPARKPRPKTYRPRKKKVKAGEENVAGEANFVADIKPEEIKSELTDMDESAQLPSERETMEMPSIVVPPMPTEEDVRHFIATQNVLQAVNDILRDAPNLISTNGISIEDIIGTKPDVNDICLEDIFDPETGDLTIDRESAAQIENGNGPANVFELNNIAQMNAVEQIDEESLANEATVRKRTCDKHDEFVCAKRRLSESAISSGMQVDFALEQLDCAIAATHDETPREPHHIFDGLVENAVMPAGQLEDGFVAEQPTVDFPLFESSRLDDIQTELIQNTSIDHIENTNGQLNFESEQAQTSASTPPPVPTRSPTTTSTLAPSDTYGPIVFPPILDQHVFLPQIDISPFISSHQHRHHLPLLPIATPSPIKEKSRNPLLAFRIVKCNSPADQSDQICVNSSVDIVTPMSRRDSLSAMSFSSSGEHTSDSLLTAASNGPEILTKHCTIVLQRIEDNESLSQYLQKDSSDSMVGLDCSKEPLPPIDDQSLSADDKSLPADDKPMLTDNDLNCRHNFLGNRMQPMIILQQLDASHLASPNECNSNGIQRTITGCNDEATATATATCRDTASITANDSNVLREIKQNSQAATVNLFTTETTIPLNDDNSIMNKNHVAIEGDGDVGQDDVTIPLKRTSESTVLPSENMPDAMHTIKSQKEEGDDIDEEEDDDDERRKSVEIDNYGAINNHNGYHHHDDDDDDYNNGKEEQKKATCGITIEFSVSNGNRDGDSGSGSSDGNGQHQTQQQRCHQETAHGKNQSQQFEQHSVHSDTDFSWNRVGVPSIKMRHLAEVCEACICLSIHAPK